MEKQRQPTSIQLSTFKCGSIWAKLFALTAAVVHQVAVQYGRVMSHGCDTECLLMCVSVYLDMV
jgi:hypothetical protein